MAVGKKDVPAVVADEVGVDVEEKMDSEKGMVTRGRANRGRPRGKTTEPEANSKEVSKTRPKRRGRRAMN